MLRIYETKLKPHLKKILLGFILFFSLFTLIGFFILPPLLKSILTNELSKALHRPVTIYQIKVNPYILSIRAKGLEVKEQSGKETFVSCDEIYLDIQSLSLFKRALILREVQLKHPYLKIIRHQDSSFNFSDLIEKKEPSSPVEKESKPLRFSLNNIVLENGSIDFLDSPKNMNHTVRDLNISIPFLSNIPYLVETFVQPKVSGKINDTPYQFEGKTKPFHDSLETFLDVQIHNLNVPHYLSYMPIKMNFKLLSATLDVQAKISFIQSKDKKPSLLIDGYLSLKETAINDLSNRPLLRLPQLDMVIAPTEPLLMKIHLSKISIQSPEFEIRVDQKGTLNLQSLIPEEREKKSTPRKKEESLTYSLNIDHIGVKGGKISFFDFSKSKPFKTILHPLELEIDHFSNEKDKKSGFTLLLKTEAKESLKMAGEFSIDPLMSEGRLEVKPIFLKKYAPYYQDQILFRIEEGQIDLSTRYKYVKGEKKPAILLSGISLLLNDLWFKREGESEDFLKIPSLSIKETSLDLVKKEVLIGNFSTTKGKISVRRLKNGDIDLLKLVPSPPQEGPLKAGNPEDKMGEPKKPWTISLKQMSIDQYTIHLEDQTPPDPVTIGVQNLILKGENLSTAKKQKGKINLSLLLNQKGTISATGAIGIDPLVADLKVDLNGIEIAPLQSYFTDRVKISVTNGSISTSGNLLLDTENKNELNMKFQGEASLNHFSSIDKLNGEDFLKWESLSVDRFYIEIPSFLIDVKGVSLTNFYARAYVNPDGIVNLQDILKPEVAKEETSPPKPSQESNGTKKEGSRNIKIDLITLQGGKIDFSDRSVNPEFSTTLSEMEGKISGLSSEENTSAEVEIRANLNQYAPLEITGKINPLKEDLYVDLAARIKDLDLSPATPYSGKYVGYTIEKGKLSFDLKYLIVKRKLDSQNNIFIDQFTFGEKVESPQATNLPVKLAVALLKDRKGEIKLDLPVTGSLDDPKFNVWKVIIKILVNLISKAATSPFSLLGAMFGGGEELSYVEFEEGRSLLTETNIKKLEVISKALQERPSLKMDIEGHFDIGKDSESLKKLFFKRKVKAQKLKEMIKKGQPAASLDDVNIESNEYERYLKMAYKEEKFQKPKNILGIPKDIPPPEMENLMLSHIEIKEGDLRTLANQRAMTVKEAILRSGQVEAERVFIIEPKSLSPEKKEKIKDSRVEFKLK